MYIDYYFYIIFKLFYSIIRNKRGDIEKAEVIEDVIDKLLKLNVITLQRYVS